MTDLQIRPIEVFDIPVLTDLHAICFTDPWDQPWTARSFAEILAMPGAGGRIAAIGDEPIGFAIARIAADEAELLSIGVHPEWRRAGHGASLLAHMLQALGAGGAVRVFLEVAAPNLKARELYRKAGFESVGSRPKYYPVQASIAASIDNVAIDAVILARVLIADNAQHSK
jgi:ribosomal-protein-alanine N-acetyltransferase